MKRRFVLLLIACLPFIIPLISYLFWLARDRKPLKILIYDMTVPYKERDEHKSLSWILVNQKYTSFEQLNNVNENYKGFFPQGNFKFVTKDFAKMSREEVLQVADTLDMVYYTDTYGVYSNEWYGEYGEYMINERSSRIYGGLHNNDIVLLQRMKDEGKLILAEFNFLASPTSYSLRKEAEKLLDVKWTGWVGRYYDPLDTIVNQDIPLWARRLYKKQYGTPWDFHQPGILFVHEDSRIVVLEMDKTLAEEVPWIYTSPYGQQKYGLPQEITYPYWFDILVSGESNRIVSKCKIYTNELGRKMLAVNGIPDVFPSVIENREKNYYYFAGDFCDNPIYMESAKFSGLSFYNKYFYDKYNYINRTPFFWNFYRPMVTNILEEYYQTLKSRKPLTASVAPTGSN